jgi:NADPH:quinone reductase-like Zn-dependent oxidoreductase
MFPDRSTTWTRSSWASRGHFFSPDRAWPITCAKPRRVQRCADDVFGALAAGELHIDIADRYTLDEVEIGHQRIESRQQVGKPIVEIG